MSVEPNYSNLPQTKCPKGGVHKGLILEKCEKKCGTFLGQDHFLIPQHKRSKILTIKCIECGDLREVKPQDAWQVKRCKSCQAKKGKKAFDKFMKKVKRVKEVA